MSAHIIPGGPASPVPAMSGLRLLGALRDLIGSLAALARRLGGWLRRLRGRALRARGLARLRSLVGTAAVRRPSERWDRRFKARPNGRATYEAAKPPSPRGSDATEPTNERSD